MADKRNYSRISLKHYQFRRSDIEELVEFLQREYKVYAPKRKTEKSYIFDEVNDVKELVLDYPRTIQPLKKFFIPPQEVLLTFNTRKNKYKSVEIDSSPRLFFGVHSYDLEAVKRLDYSFIQGKPESNYLKRRENTVFIGVNFKPDDHHFSSSVGIPIEQMEGFSLYIYQAGEAYYLFVVDYIGLKIMSEFRPGQLADIDSLDIPEVPFINKIQLHYNRLPEVFEKSYHSSIWDDVSEKCLGCGTCNLLCASCYCFEVQDEVELDIESGNRARKWDGCMLNHFAEVAGGENFRESLEQRTRHRLNRKFLYISKNFNKPFCVGCGRCSAFCPAGIEITEIINALVRDREEERSRQKKNVLISI